MPIGRPREVNITARQAEIMQEISRYFAVFKTMPTMQYIAARFQIAAPSVYDIMQTLVAKGYLAKVDTAPSRPYVILKNVEPESCVKKAIPLLGAIPCGVPVAPAAEEKDESVMIDVALTKASTLFALRLEGNSMINIGYEPGDIVVIRCQQVAESNDIIAAFLNGEATLKRLIYTPDRIALQPENPDFSTIEVSCGDDFKIVGKVIRHVKEKDIEYGRKQP